MYIIYTHVIIEYKRMLNCSERHMLYFSLYFIVILKYAHNFFKNPFEAVRVWERRNKDLN